MPWSDGCFIDVDKLNDLTCDCLECEDEAARGLDSIRCAPYLPSACGDPDTTPCIFLCADGCGLPFIWKDDDFCDCANCEDEDESQGFICNTNGGVCDCPAFCGDVTDRCEPPVPPPPPFLCQGGCPINPDYVNDNYCDCPQCDDEDSWSCATCSCPTCGNLAANFVPRPLGPRYPSREPLEIASATASGNRGQFFECSASLAGGPPVVQVCRCGLQRIPSSCCCWGAV